MFDDLARAADLAHVVLEAHAPGEVGEELAALLVAPAVSGDLGPPPAGSPARWIVGESASAARVAGAAASASAAGVLLSPVSAEALAASAQPEPPSPELDLARSRGLIALPLVD